MMLTDLMDEAACVERVRQTRWPDGVHCVHCDSDQVTLHDPHYREHYRRYKCAACGRTFNDLTGTICEDSHLPLRRWYLALYLLKLKQPTAVIAAELGVSEPPAHRMVKLIQAGLYLTRPSAPLRGTVEVDEVYQTCGAKGEKKQPPDRPRPRGLKRRGRGSYDQDRPPIVGAVSRDPYTDEDGTHKVRLGVTRNVQRPTIPPLLEGWIEQGSTVYTDEYPIYDHLNRWGYRHESVNHSAGEYARGDVHINTREGEWSVYRPHIDCHRGVSKKYLPLWVAQVEFFLNEATRTSGEVCALLLRRCLQAPARKIRQLIIKGQLATLCPV